MTNTDESNEIEEPAAPTDDLAPARPRGMFAKALERGQRAKFTEPVPATAREQVQYLLGKVKGGTRALAKRLGVSQRTVQRYAKGTITTPRADTREAMAEDTADQWQPEVRAAVRTQAATAGLVIHIKCEFGFSSSRKGATDDPRVRILRERVSGAAAAEILAAQESGADESDLHELVAAALAESYFTLGGTRADGLQVTLRDVWYCDFVFD